MIHDRISELFVPRRIKISPDYICRLGIIDKFIGKHKTETIFICVW